MAVGAKHRLARTHATMQGADMKLLEVIPALALLAACATAPDAPIIANGPPAAEGAAVALGQPVRVGAVVVTPMAMLEDSRCPETARCVWAGQLIVSTRIDGPGWRETVPVTLGKPHRARWDAVTLVSGLPERRADRETTADEYRFVFAGGP